MTEKEKPHITSLSLIAYCISTFVMFTSNKICNFSTEVAFKLATNHTANPLFKFTIYDPYYSLNRLYFTSYNKVHIIKPEFTIVNENLAKRSHEHF